MDSLFRLPLKVPPGRGTGDSHKRPGAPSHGTQPARCPRDRAGGPPSPGRRAPFSPAHGCRHERPRPSGLPNTGAQGSWPRRRAGGRLCRREGFTPGTPAPGPAWRSRRRGQRPHGRFGVGTWAFSSMTAILYSQSTIARAPARRRTCRGAGRVLLWHRVLSFASVLSGDRPQFTGPLSACGDHRLLGQPHRERQKRAGAVSEGSRGHPLL